MKKLIKPSTCIKCKKSFYGAIEQEKKFCSLLCLSTYIPPLEKMVLPNPIYPFECRICGTQVIEPKHTVPKSHKKGKCSKSCTGKKQKSRDQRKQKKIDKISRTKMFELKKLQDKEFFLSREWMQLRYLVISKNGRKCQACFATDVTIHVDHIKPRSKYPQLSLDINNLQVLCKACNLGKSNWDETDWRNKKSD